MTMVLSDFFKTESNGKSQWDWGGKIAPLALMASALINPETAPVMNSYINARNYMLERKRQEEEDQRRREWEDWTRKVQQERYEQELADRQRNIIQVTPEMAGKYGDTTFGFMFQPQTETALEQIPTNAPESVRSQVSQYGVIIPETQNVLSERQTYGTITRQDLLNAEKELREQQQAAAEAIRKAAEDEEKRRRWEEEMGLKKEELKIKWAGLNKGEKEKEPTREQKEFMNSLASLAGHYRSKEDYLADLNRNRDKIIQKLGSVAAYNALVKDVEENAPYIWRTTKVGEGKNVKHISSPGPQWRPGRGSPMATLFGGAPRVLLANNQTNNQSSEQTALSADVQRVIQQYGSIDKAIKAGRKRGLSDSNPIMKALLEAKRKRNPKDLLVRNG